MAGAAQSVPSQDFDFWEFVCCAKCHLPFLSSADASAPPSTPFWLTECGHTLCNAHLNPDRSCATCGAQGVEVMPLQREMPPPMSDWFQSAPHKLDAIAQAVKFQQECMASLVRWYQARYTQQRSILERVKNEIKEAKVLRTEVEHLRRENEQLRQSRMYADERQEPAQSVNENGKRRMGQDRMSISSPRSVMTPIGPTRLTLPPGHEQPPSIPRGGSSEVGQAQHGSGYSQQHQQRVNERPSSSRLAQQYAYIPPQTPQMQQARLSYAQQAPLRVANGQAEGQVQMRSGFTPAQNAQRMMPPPPTPIPSQNMQKGQFRPIGNTGNRDRQERVTQPQPPFLRQQQPQAPGQGQQQQQPQPSSVFAFNAPQAPGQRFATSSGNSGLSANSGALPVTSTGRFVAPTASGSRRFVPSTPSGAQQPQQRQPQFRPASTSLSGSAPQSRAMAQGFSSTAHPHPPGAARGGQRTPFLPSAQGGFN